MEVQIAAVKIRKYATSSSGDTVEVTERPRGGVSVVLADGQSSGRGAKNISTMVVRKVIALLAEGVRDGAAARAASDSLYTEKNGKVSSTLNIISIDKYSQSIVITRNNPAPTIVILHDQIRVMDEESKPIGLYHGTRPVISEIPIEVGLTIITYSDGLVHAGKRIGTPMDVVQCLQSTIAKNVQTTAQSIADTLLNRALELDQNRPADDISVVVVRVTEHIGDEVRRMTVRLPLST